MFENISYGRITAFVILSFNMLLTSAQNVWQTCSWEVEASLAMPSIYRAYENKEPYYHFTVTPSSLLLLDRSISEIVANSYDVFFSPTASLRSAYRLNPKVSVVSSIGFNWLRVKYLDPFSGDVDRTEKTYAFDLLAGARYTFVERNYIRIYSQLLVGYAHQGNADYWIINNEKKSGIGVVDGLPDWLGYQLEVGVTIGKQLYGVIDGGIGTEHMCVFPIYSPRLGVGYRF